MMLKRYDGELFWISLPEIEPKHYLWWITDKSMKPVEQLSTAVFQITEASQMPILQVFADFKTKKGKEKSSKMIKILKDLKSEFEFKYKFVWTDSEDSLKQRNVLGVTWDELPALAINSMDRNDFAYPKDLPISK